MCTHVLYINDWGGRKQRREKKRLTANSIYIKVMRKLNMANENHQQRTESIHSFSLPEQIRSNIHWVYDFDYLSKKKGKRKKIDEICTTIASKSLHLFEFNLFGFWRLLSAKTLCTVYTLQKSNRCPNISINIGILPLVGVIWSIHKHHIHSYICMREPEQKKIMLWWLWQNDGIGKSANTFSRYVDKWDKEKMAIKIWAEFLRAFFSFGRRAQSNIVFDTIHQITLKANFKSRKISLT